MSVRTLMKAGVAVVIWLAPLWFVYAELRSADSLDGISDEVEPLFARPEVVAIDGRTAAVATSVYAESPVIHSPDWAGTITEVKPLAGQPIRSGDVLLAIDGIDRIAMHTEKPFYRPLGPGARGSDVIALQRVLNQLVGETEADGDYGSATAAAVLRLSEALGATPTNQFDPGWMVWLPDDRLVLESVELSAGDRAPGAGTTIATYPDQLTHLEVAAPDGGRLELDRETPWQFVSEDGDIYELDPVQHDESVLMISVGLESIPQSLTSISGSVVRRDPTEALAVGASSITVDESGAACVWTSTSAQRFDSHQVTILRSTGGATWIDAPSLSAETDVLVNPSVFVGGRPCI